MGMSLDECRTGCLKERWNGVSLNKSVTDGHDFEWNEWVCS